MRDKLVPAEHVVIAPEGRRDAVLKVIRSARKRLVLSLFRCDDFKVLDELAQALQRKVKVEALLTQRAKGGKKRLKELWGYLESLGATLHRYADPVVKYHAKYIVADDGPALVASLNFTRKCFQSTVDFLLVTHDPAVVSGLKRLFDADCRKPHPGFPRVGARLIVGPERARQQFSTLLQSARRSIRIIDHKLTDPSIQRLLEAKKTDGVTVVVLGRGASGSLTSHGKLVLVDEQTAVIGSLALSALSLEFRREVAIIIREPRPVSQLNKYFQSLVTPALVSRPVHRARGVVA